MDTTTSFLSSLLGSANTIAAAVEGQGSKTSATPAASAATGAATSKTWIYVGLAVAAVALIVGIVLVFKKR